MPVPDPLANAVSPDTSWAVCLRPFDATGHQLMRGEVISTEEWPEHRINALVERRYMMILAAGVPVPNPTRIEGVNRRIIDLEAVEQARKQVEQQVSAPAPDPPKPTPTRKASRPTTTKKSKTTK